ncbi:MAG: hypothetical protein ABF673_00910 [Acetobacter persici]
MSGALLSSSALDPLLPYQQDVIRECLSNPVTVIEKSRRIGISWVLSWLAVTVATAAPSAGGMDVFYMGYEKDMTRTFIDDCAAHALLLTGVSAEVSEEIFKDPDKPEKDIHVFRIKFASGFEIVALPSVPRSFRSKQGLVILDEAAFVDNLAEMIKAALALRIWGARIIILSTHKGVTNPFNELILDCRSGKKPYHVMRITFDEAVEQGLYKKICQKNGLEWSAEAEKKWYDEIISEFGDLADEELHVIPANDNEAFIPFGLIQARQVKGVPVVELELTSEFTLKDKSERESFVKHWCEENLAPLLDKFDPKLRHAFGEDFARSGDLTVFWFLAIERSFMKRTPFIVELRNVPHEQQKQILFYILKKLPNFTGAMDGRGNGHYLAEVTAQEYPNRVEIVMISEAWYRESMPPLKAAFEEGEVTIPYDSGVQDDIRCLRTIRGVARVPESRSSDEKGKRHGDAAIALAMAIMASKAEVMEYGFTPIPNPLAPGIANENSGTDPLERELLMERAGMGNPYGLRGRVRL